MNQDVDTVTGVADVEIGATIRQTSGKDMGGSQRTCTGCRENFLAFGELDAQKRCMRDVGP